jgi:hypothetical protein
MVIINNVASSVTRTRVLTSHAKRASRIEIKVMLMGIVMDTVVAFGHEEAGRWVAQRMLRGGFDHISVEAEDPMSANYT